LDSFCMVMDVFLLNIFWCYNYLCGLWVIHQEEV
jgi:hypothetical protein